ncbi:hypothetical protein PtB15_17B163 [Puccinia triticina]|nr:hypothetical protein PtB15_17B163 [Puccinia triticina]
MAGNIPLPDAPASPSSSAHKPAHRSRTTNAGCDHPGPATHPIWPEYLAGTLPDPQRTRAESGYPPDRPHQPTAQLPSRQFIEIRIAQLEKERIDVENELSESSKERPEQIGHLRSQARLASIEYHDSLKRNQEILQSDAQIDPLKTQLKAALLARDSQTDSIASLKQPLSSTLVDPASSFVSLDNPALDDEAQFNFEYLRNTLLQFLEHKEMRGRPLPLSLHRCRLLERGPYFFFSTAVAIAAPLVKVLGVILHFTPQEIQLNATRNTN